MRIMYWSSVVCSSDLPESAWVLVDAAQRRVHLLEETVDALGWRDRVIVRTGRAEVLGHEPGPRASADMVTPRSFCHPAVEFRRASCRIIVVLYEYFYVFAVSVKKKTTYNTNTH